MDEVKIGSNKSFGIVFFIVFFIISIYPLLSHNEIRLWSLIISIIFLVLGLLNSKLLTPLNKVWFKFGILLGKIVSPLVTEKSTNLSEQNKVVFKVPAGANKINLKKNIEKIFKVNVTKINIINKQNRIKITRGKKVRVSGFKKAIITLKKGQSIDLTTGI